MEEKYVFQLAVSEEQKKYAYQLVDFSIEHHPVTDIFANDPDGKRRQREFRFTGTLGEVVFADAYGLARPTRSFGAIDTRVRDKKRLEKVGNLVKNSYLYR